MKNTRLYFFAYVKRLPTLNSFAFHFEIALGFPNEAKTHLEIPLFCKQSLRALGQYYEIMLFLTQFQDLQDISDKLIV